MSPDGDIRLYIVIPVYENWEDTLDCLGALEQQSNRRFDVLIADDGSPSPPPAALHDFAFARYMRSAHRGFGGNCNIAAAEAIRQGATHVLFLNNDTVFPSRFVERWLQVVSTMPEAILSPIVYWFSKPDKVWYSGGNLTIWVPFFKMRREYREVTQVDMVSGCALLVPAGHWRQLDGFNEEYETYFEDLDLTLRARQRAIRTYVVPDPELKVLHKVSGSFRGRGAWRQQYLLMTSRLIFIRTHYRGVNKFLCLGLSCAHLIAILILSLPELPQARLLWKSMVQGLATVNPESPS